ncbi:MAG TPA: winged helix DNA-binding domain-containing protein [Steroidobacteraceae bacterium]|nr:winged helix DNA-binding domain-containing protein [Steroidobacteraceae bacterium]
MRIAAQRLRTQRIGNNAFAHAADAVRWFGAIQAQDYLGALWAVGLRTRGATETSVEQAIAERAIVRTYPLRGTLHFVAAEDARWMLRLCAERTLARNAQRLRRDQSIDGRAIERSRKVLTDALRGGISLSRPELYRRLESARIATGNSRGLHLLWWHAHEGLICLGARAGKQQTFVLMDEWLPPTPPLPREAALAELARRYFTSHGPATIRDFAWWSGLAATDAAIATEMIAKNLTAATIDKQTYWQAPGATTGRERASCHLLPAYDEYTVAYQDRSAALVSERARSDSGHGIFRPAIVVDGHIAGTWSRALKKTSVAIACRLFDEIDSARAAALTAAAQRYAKFLGLTHADVRGLNQRARRARVRG